MTSNRKTHLAIIETGHTGTAGYDKENYTLAKLGIIEKIHAGILSLPSRMDTRSSFVHKFCPTLSQFFPCIHMTWSENKMTRHYMTNYMI